MLSRNIIIIIIIIVAATAGYKSVDQCMSLPVLLSSVLLLVIVCDRAHPQNSFCCCSARPIPPTSFQHAHTTQLREKQWVLRFASGWGRNPSAGAMGVHVALFSFPVVRLSLVLAARVFLRRLCFLPCFVCRFVVVLSSFCRDSVAVAQLQQLCLSWSATLQPFFVLCLFGERKAAACRVRRLAQHCRWPCAYFSTGSSPTYSFSLNSCCLFTRAFDMTTRSRQVFCRMSAVCRECVPIECVGCANWRSTHSR